MVHSSFVDGSHYKRVRFLFWGAYRVLGRLLALNALSCHTQLDAASVELSNIPFLLCILPGSNCLFVDADGREHDSRAHNI
jgi:hypothetical protein